MFTIKDFGVEVEKSVLSNGVPVILFLKEGMLVFTEVRFASGLRSAGG